MIERIRQMDRAGGLCLRLLGLLLLCMVVHGGLRAQGNVLHVRFAFTYHNTPIALEKGYVLAGQDSVVLQTLRCYVSGIQVLAQGRPISRRVPPHLIDLESPASQQVDVAIDQGGAWDQLVFELGIDSVTNVSGAQGGDLDPTIGMYWAWQSGYINFKLEGRTAVCPARKHVFQFHLGGYQFPCNALQTIQLSLADASQEEIVIDLPIDKLLEQIDLRETYEVMSPNVKAMELSRLVATLFRVQE